MNVDLKILDARMADQLPAYATPGSAGLDLRACLDAPITLQPNAWQLISTGLSVYIKDPAYAAMQSRGLHHSTYGADCTNGYRACGAGHIQGGHRV